MIPASRIIISNFATGFEQDREPFLIKNDAFPVLQNAYIFRGRIQKKRGASKLGKLTRKLGTTDLSGDLTVTLTNAPITAQTAFFLIGSDFAQDTTGTGVPVTLTGNFLGTVTLNLTTGVLTITGSIPLADVLYSSGLPVMGIEDFENVNDSLDDAPTVFFDTKYSYQFNMTAGIRQFYDVSFYKVTGLPVIWSGQDYQQFWSANFFNAMWVTNNVPGLHGVQITSVSNAPNPIVTTTTPHNLNNAVLDWIYIDGVNGLYNSVDNSGPGFNKSYVNGLSLQINTATTVFFPGTSNSVTITATVTGANTIQLNGLNPVNAINDGSGGFLQELTRATTGQDGIRWYDGDPIASAFVDGWVNFAPPINRIDPTLGGQVQTYLVGALMLVPFRGTFIAIGTWEQDANSATPRNFPQRLRWSTFSGTPFYSNPVPQEETYDPLTWISNINGRGGFQDVLTSERILSATSQQETILLGLERTQRRLVVTGSVINPFTVQLVNPEFGTTSTFSAIPLDRGTLSVGDYGFILATSFNAQRFDPIIPDQAFQIKQIINALSTGPLRVCATRNWQEETVYFTFVDLATGATYPNRTLIYNLRDPSFGILKEMYTTYGQFRDSAPYNWTNLPFQNWIQWLPNWVAYSDEPGYPQVIGGNQVGYVMIKEFDEVGNEPSELVNNITNVVSGINPPNTTAIFTIVNHNLELGDYFFLTNVAGLTGMNNTIWQVKLITNNNQFNATNFTTLTVTGTYTGNGEISILDNFLIQSKQFADAWQAAKGIRIGTQRFLLDRTTLGEFTANLLVSQDSVDPASNNPWNISTNIVRTRPDDSLGIRGSESLQSQIWHRNSNSVLGDSVQMQFSLTDAQMQNLTKDSAGNNAVGIADEDWVLHCIVIDIYPSRILV